jgi:hypothetical protein
MPEVEAEATDYRDVAHPSGQPSRPAVSRHQPLNRRFESDASRGAGSADRVIENGVEGPGHRYIFDAAVAL